METFVAVVHIIVALILIALVLVQDSKSGSLGGAFGGGGSNSLLGATGATTLAQKATRWTAVVFAITCVTLTMYSTRQNESVVDGVLPPIEAPQAPTETAPADAAPAAGAPTESAPSGDTQ